MSDPQQPQDVLASAARALRDLNAIRSKSQSGGGRSRYPYYCEASAAEVADIIDSVLNASPPQPFLWKSSTCTVSTLRSKWQQGLRYLIDHMDEDNSYLEHSKQIRMTVIANAGLRICPMTTNAAVRTLCPMDDGWRRDFQEFLAASMANSVFERILTLTPDDHTWLWAIVTGDVSEFLSHNIVPPGQQQPQNIRIQILDI